MNTGAWEPVLQAFGSLAMTILGIIAAIYLPRAVAAFERISGVQLDTAQRAAVYSAAETAKNLLVAKVEQGLIPLAHATDPNHPVVAVKAMEALSRVPDSAEGQKVTPQAMQTIIAAKVALADPYPRLQSRPVADDQPVEVRGVAPFGGTSVGGGPGMPMIMTNDEIAADLAARGIPPDITPPWKGTGQ